MAYFYVKSNGTAGSTTDAGRYASQQTGSFATLGTANYYATIRNALDSGKPNPPTNGDVICVSDASAYSGSSALFLNSLTGGNSAGLLFTCVSDTNCDQAAVASTALEHITGGAADITMNVSGGNTVWYGVYLKGSDDIFICGSNNDFTVASNCTLEVDGSTDIIYGGKSGEYGGGAILYDCDLIFHSGAYFGLHAGANFKMFGGSITGKTDLIDWNTGTSGGAYAEFHGVDMSALTDSIINLDLSGSVGTVTVKLNRCSLGSGVEFVDSVNGVLGWGARIEVANSAHDSSAEYQYYVQDEACVAQATTSFYRDNSVGYPSGQKVSIKVTTSANVSISRPFFFDLPTVYADLTSSSSDLIRYHILSSASLTDADIWMVATYPDGTNVYIPNREVSSTLTDIADAFKPFRTGTALTTNTESWTGRTTENRYQIDLDTAGDPGAKCVPIIRCYVAKPSATIYICSTPELS